MIANYLRLHIAENKGFFEYHVDFDPPVESFHYKKKILNNALQNEVGRAKTFDGAKLYLPILLPDKVDIRNSIQFHNGAIKNGIWC